MGRSSIEDSRLTTRSTEEGSTSAGVEQYMKGCFVRISIMGLDGWLKKKEGITKDTGRTGKRMALGSK